jgi:hypothetical protein
MGFRCYQGRCGSTSSTSLANHHFQDRLPSLRFVHLIDPSLHLLFRTVFHFTLVLHTLTLFTATIARARVVSAIIDRYQDELRV